MFPTFYMPAQASSIDPSLIQVLLHLEDSFFSTFWLTTDSSIYNDQIYISAEANVTSGQSKFGSKSWTQTQLYSSLRPKTYNAERFRIDNRDWCMEAWVRQPASDFGAGLLFCVGHPDLYERFITNFTSGSTFQVIQYSGGSPSWTISGTFTPDVWNHFAIVRHDTVVKLYINGVLKSQSAPGAYLCPTTSPQLEVVGNIGNAYDALAGYVDEVRVVMGDPVYRAEFDPPTAPFPDPV